MRVHDVHRRFLRLLSGASQPDRMYKVWAKHALVAHISYICVMNRIRMIWLLAAVSLLLPVSCRKAPSPDREQNLEAARGLFAMGNTYEDNFYLVRAQDCYAQALHLADSTADPQLFLELKLRMSGIYRFYRMYSKEETELVNACSFAMESGDSSLISRAYLLHGMRKKDLGELPEAMAMLKTAADYAAGLDSAVRSGIEKEIGIVYIYKEKKDSAEVHVRKAIALSQSQDTFLDDLLACLQCRGWSDSLYWHFDRMAAHFNVEKRAKAYRYAASVLLRRGDTTKAVEYFQRHLFYRDTLEADRKQELMEKLQNFREFSRQQEHISMIEGELDHKSAVINRLIVLVLCFLLVLGVFYGYAKKRKADLEIDLLNSRVQYFQERQEKEEAELAALKQKLEYFRRLNEMTIPVLMSGKNDMGAIHLKDADWDTIRKNTDSCFDSFTSRLAAAYPNLTDEEISFCCLVKMGVSMTVLSEVYHIAKGSISRKKMRMKEKMGIEGMSFDDFVAGF